MTSMSSVSTVAGVFPACEVRAPPLLATPYAMSTPVSISPSRSAASPRRRRFLHGLLLTAALALLPLRPAGAQPADATAPPAGVSVAARLLNGGLERAYGWNCAIFDLRNDGAAEVEVVLEAHVECLPAAFLYHKAAHVPVGSRRRVFLDFWSGSGSPLVRLAARFPGAGVGRFERTASLVPRGGEDRAVAWVAGTPTSPRPPEIEGCDLVPVPPGDLPPQPASLLAFDRILWSDPAPGQFSTEAGPALLEWVRRGGRLIVATQEATRLRAIFPELLAGLTCATVEAGALGVGVPSAPPPRTQAGTFTALQVVAPGAVPLAWTEHGPAVVDLPVDRGVITCWGLPLAPGFGQAHPDAEALLRRVLRADGPSTPEDRQHTWGDYGWIWTWGRGVSTFPATGFPSLSSLALWILLFAFAAGPLDYCVLRRFRRLTWTWLTFPFLVLVFTLIVWRSISAHSLRRPLCRRLQLVEAAPDGRVRQVHIYAGLFVPEPQGLTAVLAAAEGRLFTPVVSSSDRYAFTSWAGRDESVRIEEGSGETRLRFDTAPGHTLVIAGHYALSSRVVSVTGRARAGRIEVSATNHASLPVGAGRVYFRGRVCEVGPLPPGGSVEARAGLGPPTRALNEDACGSLIRNPWDLEERLDLYHQLQGFDVMGELLRTPPVWRGGRDADRWATYVAGVDGLPCPLRLEGIEPTVSCKDFLRVRFEVSVDD